MKGMPMTVNLLRLGADREDQLFAAALGDPHRGESECLLGRVVDLHLGIGRLDVSDLVAAGCA